MLQLIQSRVLRIGAGSLALLFAGAFVAAAQNPPLAEVARKEEERRKTVGTPTKVLTNKDLPKVTSPAPAPATAGQAAEAPKPDAAAPDSPKDEKNEAWWRARITEPREALRRDEVLIDALQSRVNALTTDFASRDDPYQRARVGEDRQKALAEMDRMRAEIEALKKSIDDIEEEARKAGVPPGWLR